MITISSIRHLDDLHAEFGTGSKTIIVDVCQFTDSTFGPAGRYEVFAMRRDGKELAEYTTMDYAEAVEKYRKFVRKVAPEKYRPLIQAIEQASEAADAIRDGDDGGTCNFDDPALKVPDGMTFQQVKACAMAAGINAIRWKPVKNGPIFAILSVKVHGQGNLRTEGAEAAHDVLNGLGYDCTMYYEMD